MTSRPTDSCCCGKKCVGNCACKERCAHCGGTATKPHCPPKPYPCHDGTVNLPPHDPPPKVTPNPDPKSDRPPKGSPAEPGWFDSSVKDILKGPPSFGPRKNEYLPYLVIRANPGDRGARPFPGVFWESPDILLTPQMPADQAPLKPANTGGVAVVGAPTTLYAHVWNLGRAPVWGAYVEFWWFNPSLGFNYANANRIGSAMVDLGDRFTTFPEWREVTGPAGDRYLSRGCHAIVKCPTTWTPTWENEGHECLVVRVFEPLMDAVALTNYDARNDRHVGQRNIAVVQAHSPAELDLLLDVPSPAAPGRADIEVSIEPPSSMPWLQLHVGPNHPIPVAGDNHHVIAGVLPPTMAGTPRMSLTELRIEDRAQFLSQHERFKLGCDPVQVGLHAAADLERGRAYVVRVRLRVEGTLVGGYTVVLVRS